MRYLCQKPCGRSFLGDTVTVAPVELKPDTSYSLTLRIIKSAAEPSTLYTNPTTAGTQGPLYIDSDKIAFKTAASELLLTGTNLYTDQNGIRQTPSAEPIFPASEAIVFTFNAIPADAIVSAELKEGDATISTTAVISNNTVSIPVQKKRNTEYTVSLKIFSGNQRLLYANPTTDGVDVVRGFLFIAKTVIKFKTAAVKKLALIRTNLYTVAGIDTTPVADLNNFALNGNIILTYGDAILAGAGLDAVLKTSAGAIVPATVTPSGASIIINPVADLNPGAAYHLWLRVAVDNTPEGEYWSVSETSPPSSVAFKSQPFTKNNDSNYYIGFSTTP
ncbi:MAG: Ig-like domain-containing protein [Treponema sp.]|nr:Ig-like domain-containing protein [Treponema sp.]